MEMLTLAEVADRMGTDVSTVRGLVKERRLLAVREDGGAPLVPARLLDGTEPVKHLYGVLNLLHDAGYSPDESLRWLCEEDATLPGSPLDALHENRATEIKRRAQALGF
jgi:Rv2175c C-terminal domain of unknown function